MIELELVTPERLAFTEQADFVVLPGLEGEIGVLPGHAPLLTQLAAGELRIQRGDNTELFAVSGGFAEVLRDRVRVFAETAGGTTVAVLKKLVELGRIEKDETVVAYITGNGLKTQEAVADSVSKPHLIEAKIGEFRDLYDRLSQSKKLEPVSA